eukprot:scaffold25699_cov137-Cylindrotheca_fusiformis.AAC.2
MEDDKKHDRRRFAHKNNWFFLLLMLHSCCLRLGASKAPDYVCSARTLQQFSLNYYSQPKLEWMVRLDEDIVEGNAVVQSPFDPDILYVVTHSGTLVVLSATDGQDLAKVNPTPSSSQDGGEGYIWSFHCNSGISFGETTSGENFLVYSIVDDPPASTEESGPRTWSHQNRNYSRVIAVSIPSHKSLWKSAQLPGIPMGSPLPYVNRNDEASNPNYIVLTHNKNISTVNDTQQVGHMTLLSAENGDVKYTIPESELELTPKGFGPPSVATNPSRGMYAEGMQNSNDIVVWASNDEDGRGTAGHTFAFQLPTAFKDVTGDLSELGVEVLKRVSWNAVTRPALSRNGTHMYFGVTDNQLRGWTGKARFDQNADWSAATLFDDDSRAPIPTTPVLSCDENRLFVSSSSFDFASVNTITGKANWKVSGTSAFLSEARISPDDERIYVAQSADGRIFCYDQQSGDSCWERSCDDFEEDCSNSIRADFAVSTSGQFLYFSDVKGRVIALKLGDVAESSEPTAAPVSPDPLLPTNDIDWPSEPDQPREKEGSSMAGTIALIVLAMTVTVASGMYIAMVNRRKRAPHPMQEPVQEPDEYDPNGLDPYEDSMIIQHAHKQIQPAEFPEEYYADESLLNVPNYPPSDRISVLMGTANRIAPLREDFSYGASVLV